MTQQQLDKERQIEKENTIEKLKKKIIKHKAMQYGIFIVIVIVIVCGFIFIPKEWLEEISFWLSIIGSGGGLTGGGLWLYKHFQKKIETMQNKIKETNND
ncbi:TPA: hypothetical protein ACTN5N_001639 [Campylobacter jejuni]